jgi:hypothetical protein
MNFVNQCPVPASPYSNRSQRHSFCGLTRDTPDQIPEIALVILLALAVMVLSWTFKRWWRRVATPPPQSPVQHTRMQQLRAIPVSAPPKPHVPLTAEQTDQLLQTLDGQVRIYPPHTPQCTAYAMIECNNKKFQF